MLVLPRTALVVKRWTIKEDIIVNDYLLIYKMRVCVV